MIKTSESLLCRFTGERVSTAIYAGPYDILLTLRYIHYEVMRIHLKYLSSLPLKRFAKEENLLTLTIEAPHLGRSGSFFKDGPEEQHEFRLKLFPSQVNSGFAHQVV